MNLKVFQIVFGLFAFTLAFLPADSLHYLSLHAHMGIIGWFLLLVVGVGSRLIPMFLISKYTNAKLLWWIYALINGALVSYIVLFSFTAPAILIALPALLLLAAVSCFMYYCHQAYKQRIRRQVDDQVKISLFSVLMIAIPVLLLLLTVILLNIVAKEKIQIVIGYGFLVFFGWITAIILGMTFKTLPFIVWNKVYHHISAKDQTPNPKDLFSHTTFRIMGISYLSGLIVFTSGVFTSITLLLNAGAMLLVITSFLYNISTIKIMLHKAVTR